MANVQKEMQSVLAKSRIVRDKLDEPLKSIVVKQVLAVQVYK